MASHIIQISVSDTELAHLQKLAEEEGMTVSLYIKSRVLENTDFKRYLDKLKTEVSKLESGKTFNIRQVFGVEWNGIQKGVRLALGKAFNNYVKSGAVNNIKILEKDSAQTQWYEIL